MFCYGEMFSIFSSAATDLDENNKIKTGNLKGADTLYNQQKSSLIVEVEVNVAEFFEFEK